jgi:hypothetical protein
MNKILICEENHETIETIFRSLYGYNKEVRFYAKDAFAIAKRAEVKLDELNIPQQLRLNTRVYISESCFGLELNPNCSITEIRIRRSCKKDQWYLIGIETHYKTRTGRVNRFILSDDAILYLSNQLHTMQLEL